MPNQTVSSDQTMATTIANGLDDGQNITIQIGVTLTVNGPVQKLIGQVNLDGILFLDGANASEPIVWAGEFNEEINVNGPGQILTTLGWWEFPTTSNGTASQTFDCSTYYTNAIIDHDVFAGVWVETGRRINYTGGSGIAPQVGDWVFAVNDQSIHGRIEQVSGDGTTGYIVVRFLTGALANGDPIELHTIQDNDGPDYQISWTATANGADVLEPDVWQEFGNVRQNGANNLASMGSGMAGFCFQQAHLSSTILFGDGTNGFIPPNGARIRVPNIHFATSTTGGLPDTSWITNNNSRYQVETQGGGSLTLRGVSIGSAHFEDADAGGITAEYCAAVMNLGFNGALSRATYDHCIFVSDTESNTASRIRYVPGVSGLTQGADIRDCLNIAVTHDRENGQLGGNTSSNINIERCIQISNVDNNAARLTQVSNFTINDFVVIGTAIVFDNSRNGTIRLLKTQKNRDGSVNGNDSIVIENGSSDLEFQGIEILNNSTANDSKILITSSNSIKIFASHFFNRKFDNDALGGTQGEEFISTTGTITDLLISRCWQTGGDPNEFGLVGNTNIYNCSGSYDGEISPDGINSSFRGLQGGNGPLGSSTGLKTNYSGTRGAHFGDVFNSDTEGYIYCRNVPGTTEYPITINGGTPLFKQNGQVNSVLGDEWEIEQRYFAKGHLSFTGVITTSQGGGQATFGADNWTGVDIDFQYDLGGGFNGTWLDLRTASNLTSIPSSPGGIELKLRFTGNSTQTDGEAVLIHTTTTLAAQQSNLHSLAENVEIVVIAIDENSNPIEGASVYMIGSDSTVLVNGETDQNGRITETYAGTLPLSIDPSVSAVRSGSGPIAYSDFTLAGDVTSAGYIQTAILRED